MEQQQNNSGCLKHILIFTVNQPNKCFKQIKIQRRLLRSIFLHLSFLLCDVGFETKSSHFCSVIIWTGILSILANMPCLGELPLWLPKQERVNNHSQLSLLNQTEPEARPSASKSFAVHGASGSHSTAEPKTKGVGGNAKDGSNSETHGRIRSSDVVSYDILWGRKCWKPVESAINRIGFISPPQPQRFVLKSLQVGMMH